MLDEPALRPELPRWIDKAILEASKGAIVVVLVPARPDTKWFARAWNAAEEVLFVRGRLKFEGAPSSAPFPSVVFVLRPILQHTTTTRRVGFLDTKGNVVSY